MELQHLLATRRMTRSFDGTPLNADWLESQCALALWAPTAGNTAGVRCHVVGPELVSDFFAVATDEGWRETSRRYSGLARAGGVVLVTSRPGDYAARYREDDKSDSGLGEIEAWPLPYWHTDAAMATMALLLLFEEGGLQATIWGNFRHDAALRAWAGLEGEEIFATVLVGRADGNDVASASLSRAVPSRRERVTRVKRP